jgi:hypothetical protein
MHLYPVQGPLSQQNPTPIYAGTAGATGISFTSPSGEACESGVSNVAPGQPASDLAGAWDAIYGPGYYVAHVLGATAGHFTATFKCSGGTMFEWEASAIGQTVYQGAAKDNIGNVYKVSVP